MATFSDLRTPTESSHRIVSGLPADLVTLAHQGSKAYSESFDLIHRREADRPNAIWQADHTPSIFCWFDQMVKLPSPGSRSLSTTTAGLWLDTFFRSKI